jgi:hypothetical protein
MMLDYEFAYALRIYSKDDLTLLLDNPDLRTGSTRLDALRRSMIEQRLANYNVMKVEEVVNDVDEHDMKVEDTSDYDDDDDDDDYETLVDYESNIG